MYEACLAGPATITWRSGMDERVGEQVAPYTVHYGYGGTSNLQGCQQAPVLQLVSVFSLCVGTFQRLCSGVRICSCVVLAFVVVVALQTEQDVSFYLDHSNSDLDWSRGASGRSASAPQITRYRASPMPQIAESADELVGEAGPQHLQPRVQSELLQRAPQVQQQQQDEGGRGPLSEAELLEQCEMQLAVQQQLQDGLKPAPMLKQQPLKQQQQQELNSGEQSVPLPTPDASREAPIRPHVTAADAASDAAAAAAWGAGPEGVQPATKAGPSRPSKGPAAAAGAAAGGAGQQHPMLQFLGSEGGTGTDCSSFEGPGPQGQGSAVAQ